MSDSSVRNLAATRSNNAPRIIVTGGAGYIGSHTCVALSLAGFVPVIVDNFSNSERSICARVNELCGFEMPVYDVDCCDQQALCDVFYSEPNIVGVIHFAAHKSVAESLRQPRKYYGNNVGSLETLMRVMRKHGVTNLVFSSSCTVYGSEASMPVTEATPFGKADSPYGATKQLCEALLTSAARTGAPLRSALLRYFNPVGAHPSGRLGEQPTGKPENLMPILMQSVEGARGPLTVFGTDYNTADGSCIRDFIHVQDLASAHVQALMYLFGCRKKSLAEAFNIGTGTGTTVLQLMQAFKQATGKFVPHTLGQRRPGDIPVMYANAEKAARLLHWKAELEVTDAMRDAWRWWKTQATSMVDRAATSC